jgi:hypothetical protein
MPKASHGTRVERPKMRMLHTRAAFGTQSVSFAFQYAVNLSVDRRPAYWSGVLAKNDVVFPTCIPVGMYTSA